MSTARAHHFVPRCYLNNFTIANRITVVDLTNGRIFSTNPKNVAQERDFNRIESDELEPDALEKAYGAFEGEVAPILKRLAGGASCSEDDLSYVLNLITLLAIRNPRFRERFGEFQDNVRRQIMSLQTSTKERWDSQLAKAKAAGYMEGIKEVPYEEIRASVVNRDFRFVTTTSEHARVELNAFDKLLHVLAQRRWRCLRAEPNSGGFITSDHPVCLFWNKPPRGFAPLGYGLTGTTVTFPVSPLLALEGRVGGPADDLVLDVFSVGLFNRRMIENAHRQIYAANDKFLIFDMENFYDANDVLQRVREAPQETNNDVP
jgi:hypothetical protein